jgi:hypothetical protein
VSRYRVVQPAILGVGDCGNLAWRMYKTLVYVAGASWAEPRFSGAGDEMTVVEAGFVPPGSVQ